MTSKQVWVNCRLVSNIIDKILRSETEVLQEARGIAAEVGIESRRLYIEKIITEEDLNKILTAPGNLIRSLDKRYAYIKSISEEVDKMLKTLYDPVVEEKGRQEGLKESIHFFLADYSDYSEFKHVLEDRLKLINDFSRLQEILKISARSATVKEVIHAIERER